MRGPEDEATKQANLLRDKGDFDGAIAAYTEAIRLNPQNAQLYSGRGQAYQRKGEFDKAIADCNHAIQLDPMAAEPYCMRGASHGRNGDADKAIADFTEAIRLNQNDAEAYYNRGCEYGKKGDHDQAINDFTAAIQINPKVGYPFYARGFSHLQKGEKSEAHADFAQAEKLGYKAKPDRPAGWHTANESRRLLAIIWASPYTLLGLFLGGIGLCTGARVRIRGGVVEFYGGGVKWLLKRFPLVEGASACTLGHTILGQTDASLDISRDHEMVHVRQFERWGPLMGPAYLGCCLVLWLMRRRPYWDNPFEREAFGKSDSDE